MRGVEGGVKQRQKRRTKHAGWRRQREGREKRVNHVDESDQSSTGLKRLSVTRGALREDASKRGAKERGMTGRQLQTANARDVCPHHGTRWLIYVDRGCGWRAGGLCRLFSMLAFVFACALAPAPSASTARGRPLCEPGHLSHIFTFHLSRWTLLRSLIPRSVASRSWACRKARAPWRWPLQARACQLSTGRPETTLKMRHLLSSVRARCACARKRLLCWLFQFGQVLDVPPLCAPTTATLQDTTAFLSHQTASASAQGEHLGMLHRSCPSFTAAGQAQRVFQREPPMRNNQD